MDKRDIYLFITAIGIETIAVGVGMMVSQSWGWGIASVGLIVFVVFLCFAIKAKSPKYTLFKLKEMEGRIEARQAYLPQVITLTDIYVAGMETLARDKTFFDLVSYSHHYFRNKQNLTNYKKWTYLFRQKAYLDNLVFRSAWEQDNGLQETKIALHNLVPNIENERLRKAVLGTIDASHIAASAMIFLNLTENVSDVPPKYVAFLKRLADRLIRNFHNKRSWVRLRIDELLGEVGNE